jgi:hypothetical protein
VWIEHVFYWTGVLVCSALLGFVVFLAGVILKDGRRVNRWGPAVTEVPEDELRYPG